MADAYVAPLLCTVLAMLLSEVLLYKSNMNNIYISKFLYRPDRVLLTLLTAMVDHSAAAVVKVSLYSTRK